MKMAELISAAADIIKIQERQLCHTFILLLHFMSDIKFAFFDHASGCIWSTKYDDAELVSKAFGRGSWTSYMMSIEGKEKRTAE
jgi:hypothetical protein